MNRTEYFAPDVPKNILVKMFKHFVNILWTFLKVKNRDWSMIHFCVSLTLKSCKQTHFLSSCILPSPSLIDNSPRQIIISVRLQQSPLFQMIIKVRLSAGWHGKDIFLKCCVVHPGQTNPCHEIAGYSSVPDSRESMLSCQTFVCISSRNALLSPRVSWRGFT